MGDISEELLFVRTLERVRQTAREQGNYIGSEQVKEEFSSLNLNDRQLKMIFDYLAKYDIRTENAGLDAENLDENKFLSGGKRSMENISLETTEDMEEILTETERDYLQTYLDEIAALPVYDAEALEADVLAAMAGDGGAQRRLMESVLKDVTDIAKLYVGQGVLIEDLIGEGNMALAVELQMIGNGEQKSSGITYSELRGELAKKAMDAMEALIRENVDNEKADKKVEEKVNLVADKARELAEELRRKVTADELAQEADLSVNMIRDAMRMSGYKIEDLAMEDGQE